MTRPVRLTELGRPFIVGVAVETSWDQIGPAIERAHREGADAVEVNLAALDPAGAQGDRWRPANAAVPVYTSARRRAFMQVYGLDAAMLADLDDDHRMRWQLALLEQGSVALDMELDTFDPMPAPVLATGDATNMAAVSAPAREMTRERSAVTRQRALVREAHDSGGEVLASCHTGSRQDAESLRAIVETAAERGADLVKVVTPCPSIEDLEELITATARLREADDVPFALVGTGACGALSRYIGPTLGSGWALARLTDARWSFSEQPTVSQVASVLDAIPWRYAETGR